MCMKYRTFSKKKDDYPSLDIYEVLESERDGHLNV